MSKFSPKFHVQWSFLFAILFMGVVVSSTVAQEGTADSDPPKAEIIQQTEEPGVVNTILRIYANQDAFVSSNYPNNNYGNWSQLRSGRDATYGATRTLIQFDFQDIPSNAIINNASLFLYQNESIPASDSPYILGLRYLNSAWAEDSVTWANHEPEWGSIFGEIDIDNLDGWKSFDVTELTHNWVSGSRPNYGMLIQGSDENQVRERVFASREVIEWPYIDVNYSQYDDTCPPSAWFTSTLNQFSQSSFTVSWDGDDCGSNGNLPSGVRNFDVQYSTDNTNWTNWKMDTQNKSGTFHGVNGQIYYFRVRAADNALNIGPWSGSISTIVDTQPPTNLSLTIDTVDGSSYVLPYFQVSWSAVDYLSGVQTYVVQWNNNAGSGWVSAEFPAYYTSDWQNGAAVGETYSFRMQAIDQAGNTSDWTPIQNVTVISDPTSIVRPFNPVIIPGPTFDVFWQGFSTNVITQFVIKYQVDGGPWQEMAGSPFPGTQSFAQFDASTLAGWPFTKATIVGFEVAATAQNLPQETFKGIAEATIVLDPNNTMTNMTYMPIVFR